MSEEQWAADLVSVPLVMCVEFTATWCTDHAFLSKRAAARQQLSQHRTASPTPAGVSSLSDARPSSHSQSSDASPPARRSGTAVGGNGAGQERSTTPAATATATDSSPSSDTQHGEGGRGGAQDNGEWEAHPLLPRHSATASRSASPFFGAATRRAPRVPGSTADDTAAAAAAPLGDPSHRLVSRGNRTVLSLLCVPSTEANVWYHVLRSAVMIVWSVFATVRTLLCLQPHSALSVGAPVRPERASPAAHWSAICTFGSPVAAFSSWFSHSVPFAPTDAEVDLFLWSWWSRGNPQPQFNLRDLREELLLRRRGDNAPARSPLLGLASPAEGHVLTALVGSRDRMAPDVLCTWRPSWWFTRYAVLSALAAILCFLSCYLL